MITLDNCPCCDHKVVNPLLKLEFKNDDFKVFFDQQYHFSFNELNIKKEYFLTECTRCSLVYQKNILDEKEMENLYEKYIDPDISSNKKLRNLDKDHYIFDYIRELEAFNLLSKKYKIPMKLIDIGSGWGIFLDLARLLNFETYGIELSENRRNRLIANGHGVLDCVDQIDKSTCLVNMDQFLEHIPYPGRYLKNLFDSIGEESIIRIRVPNSRLEIQHVKRYGKLLKLKGSLQPLEHINCFTPKSLKYAVEEAGFDYIGGKRSGFGKSLNPRDFIRFSTYIWARKP